MLLHQQIANVRELTLTRTRSQEESFSLGQNLHTREENDVLVHSKSADELQSYAGILYGAPAQSTRTRSIWTDKKVRASFQQISACAWNTRYPILSMWRISPPPTASPDPLTVSIC